MAKMILSENRKQLIEKYVDHRIQRLQLEATSGITDEQLMEWEWPSWDKVKQVGGKIYDTSADVLSAAGNVPIFGKVPGMIGGGMQLAKGAYNKDPAMMAKGGANIAFSGIPGGGAIGKTIAKQGIKQIAKHTGNKVVQKVGGDLAKIGAKTATKAALSSKNKNVGKPSPSQVTPNVNMRANYA